MPDETTLQQINQKLDMFIQLYRDRHEDLEERVAKVEQRVENIEGRINNLHDGSMKFVRDALQELERRIFDKLEDKQSFGISQWIIVVGFALQTIIGIGAILVAFLK